MLIQYKIGNDIHDPRSISVTKMIPIVMSVDVTSFKRIYNLNLTVPGLIFDIGGNK